MGLHKLKVKLAPFSSWHPSIDSVRIEFRASADPDSQATISKDIARSGITADLLSLDSLVKFKAWLGMCIEQHEPCSRTISGQKLDPSNAPLPTRCIKILGINSEGGISCHLEETLGMTGSYVTLSHRFNALTEQTKTTRENYQDRLLGKGVGIPAIFSDTLTFAHKFSINYVWIDSICIIQDGVDFETESLKMASYYQGAMFTLAAAINTSSKGLELAKSPSQLMPQLARLPYRDESGKQNGHFYLCQTASKIREAYTDSVDASELLKRGWVFQQWLLSRGIICFASNIPGQRVFCQCQNLSPRNEFSDYVFAFDKFWSSSYRFQGTTLREFWSSWRTFVKQYSGLQLSDHRDRIRALAGVAAEFRVILRSLAKPNKKKGWIGSFIGSARVYRNISTSSIDPEDRFWGAYAAGSWIRNIYAELMWVERRDSRVKGERLPDFPTWSWASFNEPISWMLSHEGEFDTCFTTCRLVGTITKSGELYDIDDTTNDPQRDPLEVSGLDTQYSILKFKGRLISIVVRDHLASSTPRDLKNLPGLDAYSRDKTNWDDLRKICSPLDTGTFCGWGAFEHPDFQSDESFRAGDDIQAFSISVDPHGGHIQNVLFVRRLADPEKFDHFERVGAGKLFGWDFEMVFKRASECDILLC